MFDGFAAHILTVLLAGGAIEGWRYAWKLIKERRPLTKLFPFDKNQQVWIALSQVPADEPGEFFDKASPIDGVYSFDDLSDNLRKIGLTRQHFATRFSSDLTSSNCEDNLILIGGYENNKISEKLNAKIYRQKRHFYLENNTIKERGGEDRTWGVVLDSKRRISVDYCLVSKIENPFCTSPKKKSWILAFEGVREYGTWGAVRHWNESLFKEFKHLGLNAKRNDKLEMVIAIKVNQDNDNPFQQIEFGGIKSAYLNEAVKK
jgi:hypothetical protein